MQYLTYLHGMKYGLYMDYTPLGGAVPPNNVAYRLNRSFIYNRHGLVMSPGNASLQETRECRTQPIVFQ